MMDLFSKKAIHPMLIAEQEQPFDSEDHIFEIKLDGIRCIAYLGMNETDLRNKRNLKLLSHVPELSELHKQVRAKCILDGELFVMKNGVTDFYEIQKRIIMTDPFKIRLASETYPACFSAFDILYLKDRQLDMLPLMERKKLLSETVIENDRFSMSRYIERHGIQLYDLAKMNGLEGIVAKRKDSMYLFDKRSRSWIKCKVMSTEDCVICGYIQKSNAMTSLILGQYNNDLTLIYRGHVTLGVSLRTLNQYVYHIMDNSPFGYIPKGNENAIWLKPSLVCIVESMPTEKNAFRQPVFKGIREDKLPCECTIASCQ